MTGYKEYELDHHVNSYYDTTMKFDNADGAFRYYYDLISDKGIDFDTTKTMMNIGFYLMNPSDNLITTPWRKWTDSYAELEWSWYLSGDPNATIVANKAKIWLRCMDENGNVNSNYGYQWNRGNQIDYIVNELNTKPNSRRASISLYDAKEHELYSRDTICTYAINFTIIENKLNMSVLMRSNDLWFGFCNDQYCFSKLQEMILNKLDNKNIKLGWYYHFSNNLHIYNEKLNKKK